jgi:ribonuclease MRP protein subunit RMP1
MAISISTSTTTTMAPASTITATALLAAPAHDIAKLHDIHELLNKIFTRNKNQHRRSHWWKSLHAFRKQLNLLLRDLETSGKLAREEKLQARLKYWDEKCVHMWY